MTTDDTKWKIQGIAGIALISIIMRYLIVYNKQFIFLDDKKSILF